MSTKTCQKTIFVALCLAGLVCDGFAQMYFGASPGHRLRQSCFTYNDEKNQQNKKQCNPTVLEKVDEFDRNIYGDGFMKKIFQKARRRRLCYAEGPIVREVRGACHALEVTCNTFSRAPVEVDECWSIVIAAGKPPVSPPGTARPPVPDAPPGRRF